MKQFQLWGALAVILTTPFYAFAQTSQKTVLGSFIYNNKVYNLDFKQLNASSYKLTITGFPTNAKASQAASVAAPSDITKKTTETAAADTPKGTVDKISDVEEKDYIFSELSQDVFTEAFIAEMNDKFHADTNDRHLKDLAISKFTFVQDNLHFQDDEPVTAYFRLRSDGVSSFLAGSAPPFYQGALGTRKINHKVDHVDIETQDGAIKNIQVFLKPIATKDKTTKDKQEDPSSGPVFKNQFPISISSKFDPDRFADIDLYSFNCNGVEDLTRYMKLSDILQMRLVLANNKEDYSPSDRVVTLSPTLPTAELKKEKRSRIIEINAFTDFIGLDQEEPNGLIQIEAKRKINILTHSWPFFKLTNNKKLDAFYNSTIYKIDSVKSNNGKTTTFKLIPNFTPTQKRETKDTEKIVLNNRTQLVSGYFSIFSYIEPRLLFSKLDGNNRNYLLDTPAFTSKKLNPLKNYQYQLASLGFDLNLLKFSFPDLKFSWNVIDAGVYWYRTRVQAAWDTVSKHSTPLNNGIFKISSRIDFHTDSRWGAGLMLGRVWQHLWSDVYTLPVKAGLWQAGFDGFLVTNDADNSKMFFRFRWTGDAHHFDTNFTQIQVGYSMNIFVGTSTGAK